MIDTNPSPTGEPMAAEICRQVQVEKPARGLLRENLTALEFVQTLTDAGQFSDAARILAYLLPARDAVWWAIQSARQNPLRDAGPEVDAALAAAETWVLQMDEDSRYAAQRAAESAGLGTAAGCAAMAAFASGASLAPPGQPAVPPDPALVAHLVTGSIIASSLPPNPDESTERYRTFLQQGLELYDAARSSGGDVR
jgi:hypothetical protein